jgi:hypothetical protein
MSSSAPLASEYSPAQQGASLDMEQLSRGVRRIVDRARGEALAKLGTDPAKLDALATLRRAGALYRLTAGEMARRSLVTPGAVSQRLSWKRTGWSAEGPTRGRPGRACGPHCARP